MLIATWNVNSIRARLEHLSRYLERRQPAALCLQELKVQDQDFPFETVADAGYRAAVAGQKTYNGVAILAREVPQDVVIGFPHLGTGHPLNAQARLIAATVGGVRIFSAYLPNGEAVGSEKFAYKLEFFAGLKTYLETDYGAGDPLCLLGDFNVAPEARDVYDPDGWEGRILCSDAERGALEELRGVGFVDCFRRHHPEGGRYSWWDYRGGAFWKGQGLRIDHVWATPPLAVRCTGSDIDESPRKWKRPSDHAPVWAEFDLAVAGAIPVGERSDT